MENQQPVNPYAPPAVDIGSDAQVGVPFADLATRWQRLGAVALDALLSALTTIPLYGTLSFGFSNNTANRSLNPLTSYLAAGRWGLLAGALALTLMTVQAVLITRRGQSIGKMIVGTRITSLTGGRASFVNAVLLRAWLPAAVGMIPLVGSLLPLVDALFIFRDDRRCLHDLVAGTRVVKLAGAGSGRQ